MECDYTSASSSLFIAGAVHLALLDLYVLTVWKPVVWLADAPGVWCKGTRPLAADYT